MGLPGCIWLNAGASTFSLKQRSESSEFLLSHLVVGDYNIASIPLPTTAGQVRNTNWKCQSRTVERERKFWLSESLPKVGILIWDSERASADPALGFLCWGCHRARGEWLVALGRMGRGPTWWVSHALINIQLEYRQSPTTTTFINRSFAWFAAWQSAPLRTQDVAPGRWDSAARRLESKGFSCSQC